MKTDYLVVGAGIAGVKAAIAIREVDPDGSIILINGESCLPYKRTKLSKELQTGYGNEAFSLMSAADYRHLAIELVYDWLITHRLAEQTVYGLSGNSYCYRRLVLACGAGYQLPGPWQSPRTLTLRSMGEALALQRQAKLAKRITVVGAGVEGLELAAAYAGSHQVELIELGDRPLSTLAAPYLQQKMLDALEAAGVTFCPQETVERVDWDRQRLQLQHRQRSSSTDLLLVAIGTKVATPLLPLRPGTVLGQVDDCLRWSECIYLAGDVCSYRRRRCGLWHEAESLGITAGRNAALSLLGQQPEIYQVKLFRTKLECFGLYLFLAPPLRGREAEVQEYLAGERYYRLWFNDGGLCGANMLDDADNAKLLQRMIWQNTPRQEVEKKLRLEDCERFLSLAGG